MKSLSVSSAIPKNDAICTVSNANDVSDVGNVSAAFDESMSLLLDEAEDTNDIAESKNDAVLEKNNEVGRKRSIRGP